MSAAIAYKLLAIFVIVALGWFVGRMRWLGDAGGGGDPARVLANAAFFIFIPALLFRTTARIDFSAMPWRTVSAFFVPVLLLLLAVYAWQRWGHRGGRPEPAAPSVRAISATFGNTVQIGVPIVTAVYGEAGLGIHITIVGLHALILLPVLTTLVELDLARERARAAQGEGASLYVTLRSTVRHTVIHPVVLPVLAGLLWNAGGLGLPPVADEGLELLGRAVVPLALVLIGMSLAYYGLPRQMHGALVTSVVKLLVLPLVALVLAHWGFGLAGMPLGVVVMAAALPVGANALIFAQRYQTLEAEATAAVVFSTVGFALAAPLWLAVLEGMGPAS
jgi:malonate transporter